MESSLAHAATAFDSPFRAVAEMAVDAVVVADESGRVAYAQLEGLPITALVPGGLHTGATEPVELGALRRDGSGVPVERTIAEFVGSERCFELLRDLGVDYAQGYWLGAPEPLPPAANPLAPAAD